MKRNILGFVCILALSTNLSMTASIAAPSSNFTQYYDSAQNYLAQGQYSSAIVDLRKALSINFMDNSARIGIINSYLARATYYANQEKNYDKSANDFRSAIFYLKMFPTKSQSVQNSASMIASANENLNQCLKVTSFDKTASSRYKKAEELKIITCHLGNGSSITAVKNGKSMDTTMGFTPLAGTLMGTRCGDIDPAIVTFLMNKENLSTKDIDAIMNKKSGIFGVSGVSSDFRDVAAAADNGNKRAEVGLEMFYYEIKKFIGSYAAAMGGVDAIVFTAGIGENDKTLRKEVTSGLEFLGVAIDDEKNSVRGQEIDISAEGAKVKTLVIPTNEELMIAIETKALVD